MDAKKYVGIYVVIIVFIALVSGTAGGLLTDVTGLQTTFAGTGVESLFALGLIGLIFAALIFLAIYAGMQSLAGKKR